MTVATANEQRILRASIFVPRQGAWHAYASVEAEDTTGLTGHIDLVFGEDVTWTGYARRAGASNGRVELFVVGGAGGLRTELDPCYYVDAQAQIPLDDLMRELGETLSSGVSADVTGITLARWTRPRGRGGALLSELAEALGVESWRVLSDGTVWLGEESWPDVEIEYDVTMPSPAHDTDELAVDAPTLTAGVTLAGRRICYVQHIIEPTRIRSMVMYEADAA